MAKLLLKFNGMTIKEYPFDKDKITVGRKSDNDVIIDNPAVSGHHAHVIKGTGGYLLEDLSSTNGTFMHEQKILKANLHHKDEVAIAKHILVFINEEEKAAVPVASGPDSSSDATVVLASSPRLRTRAAETIGGLRVVAGESNVNSFSLVNLTTYIGKSPQANIRLKGFFAPDIAACVARKPDGCYLRAIKEKSVKLNDQLLLGDTLLKDGDLIEISSLKLVFFQQDAHGPVSG
jgi:pSer/pThr/pTyr-binding forkhead associated (FHA) protein